MSRSTRASTTSRSRFLEVSKMYERLKRLYQEGRASEAMLKNAVKRGWITDEEMQEIIASKKESEIPVSTPESR